jgi:hypothetical protein
MATGGECRAITKALLLGGAAAVRRLRYGVYVVASASRPGVAHTVTVDAGAYRCDCEAGRHERACWHAAAVYVAKVEHASGGRVTGPARRPAGAAGRGETAATASPQAPSVRPRPLPAAA